MDDYLQWLKELEELRELEELQNLLAQSGRLRRQEKALLELELDNPYFSRYSGHFTETNQVPVLS